MRPFWVGQEGVPGRTGARINGSRCLFPTSKATLPYAEALAFASAPAKYGTSYQGSEGKWEGSLTRHIATPAELTVLPPLATLLSQGHLQTRSHSF